MKKSIAAVLAVASTLMLSACSDGPGDVAQDFMEAWRDGDTEAVGELSTAQTAALVELAIANGQKPDEIEVVEVIEKDDQAKVKMRINGKKDSLDLRKIDGEWKVAVKK